MLRICQQYLRMQHSEPVVGQSTHSDVHVDHRPADTHCNVHQRGERFFRICIAMSTQHGNLAWDRSTALRCPRSLLSPAVSLRSPYTTRHLPTRNSRYWDWQFRPRDFSGSWVHSPGPEDQCVSTSPDQTCDIPAHGETDASLGPL